jgi:hypothetical protein
MLSGLGCSTGLEGAPHPAIYFFGGFVLQVDTFTAEQYSPHQIPRHNSKVQAPAPWGTSRLVKGLSHTEFFFPVVFLFVVFLVFFLGGFRGFFINTGANVVRSQEVERAWQVLLTTFAPA